jgi:hypothetical protein
MRAKARDRRRQAARVSTNSLFTRLSSEAPRAIRGSPRASMSICVGFFARLAEGPLASGALAPFTRPSSRPRSPGVEGGGDPQTWVARSTSLTRQPQSEQVMPCGPLGEARARMADAFIVVERRRRVRDAEPC